MTKRSLSVRHRARFAKHEVERLVEKAIRETAAAIPAAQRDRAFRRGAVAGVLLGACLGAAVVGAGVLIWWPG